MRNPRIVVQTTWFSVLPLLPGNDPPDPEARVQDSLYRGRRDGDA